MTGDPRDAAVEGLGALTLFVEDLDASTSFYRDVLGLAAVHEDADSTVFALGDTLLNLLRVEAVGDLVDPATVALPGAGMRMLLTAWVDDVDAVCAVLRSRGVALLNGPVDRPWGKRTAAFADPSGTVWEVAQDMPSDATGPADQARLVKRFWVHAWRAVAWPRITRPPSNVMTSLIEPPRWFR